VNESFRDIDTPSPRPGDGWRLLSDRERLVRVQQVIGMAAGLSDAPVLAVAAQADGQVMLKFEVPVAADRRGTVLLDLERELKQSIDPGLNVWLEALGDRNSLRNLRGIEIRK